MIFKYADAASRAWAIIEANKLSKNKSKI